MPYGIAFDGLNVWIADDPEIRVLRAVDGKLMGAITETAGTVGVAFDGANIWVSGFDANRLGKF